jgi:hypothetical protein
MVRGIPGNTNARSVRDPDGRQSSQEPPQPAVAGQRVAIVAIAVVLPYTPLSHLLGFTPLPLSLLVAIALLAVTYLFLVQAVKSWFYRRHGLL